jgi:hypothetical protein
MVSQFISSDKVRLLGAIDFNFPEGTHVRCLFHLKQVWVKHLKDKLHLGFDGASFKPATAVGGLDLLCVLPRNEIEQYGIPFVRTMIERVDNKPIPEWEMAVWEKFWIYFKRQWMPILPSWNICEEDGSYIEMQNRTNNAVESYNCRFNRLFSKQPNLIEFVELVREDTKRQYETVELIRTGMKKEPNHKKVFVPDIPQEYYDFKDYVNTNANQSLTKAKGTKPANKTPSNTTKLAKPKSPSTKHAVNVKKSSTRRVFGAVKSPHRSPLREINEGDDDRRPKRAIKREKLSI